MISITYQEHILFYYDEKEDILICPYCQLTYNFNNDKLRSVISSKIQSSQNTLELSNIMFRCIICDFRNTTYPFKFTDSEHPFTPNQEQSEVIIELYQQMLITSQSNHTNYMFLLEGQAGTGKTSTIMYLFAYPEFNYYKICFSSSTNKALSVMMEKLTNKDDENDNFHEEKDDADDEDNKPVKRSFLTVFKLTNSKTSINSVGDTIFEYQDNDSVHFTYDIIVIDEVSMIEKTQSENILNALIKAKKNAGAHTPIVIFLGDICQLPPVGEDSSVIFDDTIQQRYNIKKMTLRQIMRSQDRLTDLSCHVRQLIPLIPEQFVGQDFPIINLKKYTGNQIKYFSNKTQWLDEYKRVFLENLTHSLTNCSHHAPMMIVYTNAECDLLNTECRNLIFDYPSEQFVKGELLVFKSYYCIRRQKFINSKAQAPYFIKFFTSEPIIVNNIMQMTQTIDAFNYQYIMSTASMNLHDWLRKKVSQQQYDYMLAELLNIIAKWIYDTANYKISTGNPTLDLQLNKISMAINKLKHTYNIGYLYIDGAHKLDVADAHPEEVYITVIMSQSIDDYLANCDKIKTIIKLHYRNLMYTYKNNKIMKLLIDFIFQKIWRTYYYRTYIWPFASIVYGYAITSHRGQGSTYPHTFVNISNIIGCQKVNAIVRAKSLYTSMTRASQTMSLLYHKPSLTPIMPTNHPYKCQICQHDYDIGLFPSSNCTIDKICAEQLLNRIGSLQIYVKGDNVILSDKNKNLYVIPKHKLPDIHINDVYDYVIKQGLIKTENEKYQCSNLILIKELIDTDSIE